MIPQLFIKCFLRVFVVTTILIILLGSIVYLNYFGVSTKKFNQNIEKKFKENYPGINLKLNEVKLLLDILKFSINLETKNTLVLSGKDKGKNGKVLKIIKSKTDFRIKAIVEGVNVVKKHTKQSATSKGGIENKELPVYLCKLSILDPKTSKPTRVGIKTLEDGKKVRYAKKSGETLN